MNDKVMTQEQAIREKVKEGYSGVVTRAASSCCGPSTDIDVTAYAQQLGYSEEELTHIPEDANLGLSCGNPTAMAKLQPGEVVLDLGAGAGMDAFLAAKRVTHTGRVIGVDMTPAMLAKARQNAVKLGVESFVDFREGFIEALPVVADSVDVVISNCVINLSPNKGQVFQEAFRVLKPGGRLAVSDVCLTRELPEVIREHSESYVACISGALQEEEYLRMIREAGFTDITWTRDAAGMLLDTACHDPVFQEAISAIDGEVLSEVLDAIWSYKIEARKPL